MSSRDARIKSLQDACFLDVLIKSHLNEPSKCTDLWKTDDIEEVVEHFNVFLCSVAGKGVRLSKSFFLGRLKRYFKSDHVTLEDFAGKLSQALRYCHGKGKKCTTGKKTSTPCLKVVAAYGFSQSSRAASPPTSKESLELPTAFSDDEAGPTDAKTEVAAVEVGDSETTDTSEDECASALAAFQAAKDLYKDCQGSSAASSGDVVDLTCPSPVKTKPKESQQVPPTCI